MRCEICGQPIRGKPHRIIVENAKLTVCSECAMHGSQTWKPDTPKKSWVKFPIPQPAKRLKPILDEELILVEGYGFKIKMARERKGWTQEELASKIGEKASFISKIETEKVSPSLTVARKLEHALGISLLTREFPEVKVKLTQPLTSEGLTIGDLLTLSKQTKKGEKSEGYSG